MTTPATYVEVSALLGEVDDEVVARIVAIGATAQEVAEALASTEEERGFAEFSPTPSSPRVTEIRAILDDHVFDIEEDYADLYGAEGADAR